MTVRARGFTLIEIMVVVVILAILGTLVAPQILGRIDEARVTKARNDLRLYESALDLYRMDNFKYPTTDQGLQALVTKPNDPNLKNYRPEGYVKQLQKDPWGHDYVYVSPGTNGAPYDLLSYGADGQPGGTGNDADINLRDADNGPGSTNK
jgi:general secretion pathway protein G